MVKQELGGNIVLSGFNLGGGEMVVVRKIVGNYAKKIKNFRDYQELKLEMKSHLKAKNKEFEVKVHVLFGGMKAVSEARERNAFVALDEALSKILQEVKHKIGKLEKEQNE